MTVSDIREKYLKFFEGKRHERIPSSSLVPENDSTTLFTGSGMQPLIPYLLGEKHPKGKRLVNSQKSFRAEDIEEVGDNRHTTFFEMLGNWSLGDYFKKEQLPWIFEFLTDKEKGVGLDAAKLYISVFAGDKKNNIPKDVESVAIWKELFKQKGIKAKDVELVTLENASKVGMQGGRIFYYDAKKNWWTRFGSPENMPVGEPGGPDSEIFYDFGTPHNEKYGKECHPNCDCGRFLEIGNSVFMEYKKTDGGFEPLVQKNVDFGGGLERIVAVKNDFLDIFDLDVFKNARSAIETWSNFKYSARKKEYHIILDHIRSSVFLIADGVSPSNTKEGYILRRLIRRAVRFADTLGLKQGQVSARSPLSTAAEAFITSYMAQYPELATYSHRIFTEIEQEEKKFRNTLEKGMQEFERWYKGPVSFYEGENVNVRQEMEALPKRMPGFVAFKLFTTYGFPIELIQEIAKEREIEVDIEGSQGFMELMKKHQELSRTSSAGAFKGGLVDHEPQTIKHHTAHHLLLAALRQVLGEHVFQKGSNVSSERLRIDFSHPEKMTPEQVKKVEDIVNDAISKDLEVRREEMPKTAAEKLGALAEFGAKYGDVVSVYTIFNKDGSVFSREFCGGPHVSHTGELGHFKIIKEEASSAGVRRIKARAG